MREGSHDVTGMSDSFLCGIREISRMELMIPTEPLKDTEVASGPVLAHFLKTEKFPNYILMVKH